MTREDSRICSKPVRTNKQTEEQQHDTNAAAHTFAVFSFLCEFPSRTGEFPGTFAFISGNITALTKYKKLNETYFRGLKTWGILYTEFNSNR
jgi:hypothetical protein